MEFTDSDWDRLERLRNSFLNEEGQLGDYWSDRESLLLYDTTFAQRIGWKWDHLLEEFSNHEEPFPAMPLIDFGCGTGIASRSFLGSSAGQHVEHICLYDRSSLAQSVAKEKLLESQPHLKVDVLTQAELEHWVKNKSGAPFIVLVSHVLNELNLNDQKVLLSLLEAADSFLICEPGTFNSSRKLIGLREQLRERFSFSAPCPHQNKCGLLNPGNDSDWCHFFAKAPSEVFSDSNWVRWGKIMGIDLRSLPYSYLIGHKSALKKVEGTSSSGRILGRPREYKGYLEFLGCKQCGVNTFQLQKRDDKKAFKALLKGKFPSRCQWQADENRILRLQ